MNIFLFDPDPFTSVQMTCDAHVRVGIKELGQMLSTAHHVHPGGPIPEWVPKLTHRNHPMTKWIRQSKENYSFGLCYMDLLGDEYFYRFDKHHLYCNPTAGPTSLWYWLLVNKPDLPSNGFTEMPIVCKDLDYNEDDEDRFTIYRRYMNERKSHLFRWTRRPIPYWVNCHSV